MTRGLVMGVFVLLAGAALGACAIDAAESGVGSAEQEVKEKIFCGGIAGLACPTGMVCVDDPTDDCNPKTGGADCGGYCRPAPKKKCEHTPSEYIAYGDQCALVKFTCAEGYQPFFDNCGCGCEKTIGEPCNQVTCGAGEFCCNWSCSICAPDGGVCIQLFCG